jgi:hypothetical protein
MSDAHLFRQYAQEAMSGSSEATNENDKRSLLDLACTWVQAAVAAERVWSSSITPQLPDAKTTSR